MSNSKKKRKVICCLSKSKTQTATGLEIGKQKNWLKLVNMVW